MVKKHLVEQLDSDEASDFDGDFGSENNDDAPVALSKSQAKQRFEAFPSKRYVFHITHAYSNPISKNQKAGKP